MKISDDVAGATLMAAGASSPELMAALLSIFITHSALGMGTIVGSEVRYVIRDLISDAIVCKNHAIMHILR